MRSLICSLLVFLGSIGPDPSALITVRGEAEVSRSHRFIGKSDSSDKKTPPTLQWNGSLARSESLSDDSVKYGAKDLKPPGLETRPSISTGFVPTDVAVADFNQDGITDFAVTSGWEDSLSLFFGQGDGKFDPPAVQRLKGISPLSIEAVDVQGDGYEDLVVCQIDSRTVGVLIGNGDGTFQEEASYPVFARCAGTVSADFTGDGLVDIAVFYLNSFGERRWPDTFNIQNGLALLKGNGDSTFSDLQFTAGLWTSIDHVAAGDFDSDSDLDLVGGGPSLGAVTYTNDGNGRFTRDQELLPSPPWDPLTSVATGDLDGDGCEDVIATFYSGTVVRRRGTCDGHFLEGEISRSGVKALRSYLSDIDQDGLLDLAVVGSRLSVSFGHGGGEFSIPRVYRGQPQMVSAGFGDLDGDGLTDVVTVDQTTDRVSLFQNQDGRFFGNPGGIGGVEAPSVLLLRDLDRDNRGDILYVEDNADSPNHIVAMLAGANGRFDSRVESETHREGPIGDAVLADFRNSGNLDLLMVGRFGNMSPGSRFLAFVPGLGEGRFGPTTVSHVDGDGRLPSLLTSIETDSWTRPLPMQPLTRLRAPSEWSYFVEAGMERFVKEASWPLDRRGSTGLTDLKPAISTTTVSRTSWSGRLRMRSPTKTTRCLNSSETETARFGHPRCCSRSSGPLPWPT